MKTGKACFEDYIALFEKGFRPVLKAKLTYKNKLEADGRLKLPLRIWLAFLTPVEQKAWEPIPAKFKPVLVLKKTMLESFKHPKRLLEGARSARVKSDCVTLCLLEILYNLETHRILLSQKEYDEWLEVADRFGLWKLRYALEDALFKILDPENFSLFESVMEKKMFMDQHLVLAIHGIVRNALERAGLAEFEVKNRKKNISGVYKKVALKDININEIYDIHGFRILTSSVKDSYRAVDVLHRLWPQLPERYKDYIKKPKENGYQSIHTVVSCLERKPIEFQVRTYEMDVIAASGPANHAEYKRNGKSKF